MLPFGRLAGARLVLPRLQPSWLIPADWHSPTPCAATPDWIGTRAVTPPRPSPGPGGEGGIARSGNS